MSEKDIPIQENVGNSSPFAKVKENMQVLQERGGEYATRFRRQARRIRRDFVNGWDIRGSEDKHLRARVGLALIGGLIPFVQPIVDVGQFMLGFYDTSSVIQSPPPLDFLLVEGAVGATAGYILSEGWNVVQSYKTGRNRRKNQERDLAEEAQEVSRSGIRITRKEPVQKEFPQQSP